MKRNEWVYFLMVVLIFSGALYLDEILEPVEAVPFEVRTGDFISTGWYCPAPGFENENVMSTTNLARTTVKLRRGSIGSGRTSDLAQADLKARTLSLLRVDQFGVAEASGVVEAFGAETLSDLTSLGKSKGVSSTECTTQPWDRWLFAAGSTARGQKHYLLVANPFEEEAVVRVSVLSPDGEEAPSRLKDFFVPAMSQASVFLSEFIVEKASFGLDVRATQGRVVVSRYSEISTRDGLRGTSLSLGSRTPSKSWLFAGGEVPANGSESFWLVNPSINEALIQVSFSTDQGTSSPPGLQELAVPARRQVLINVADHLPVGQRHSTHITTINDVEFVVERQTVLPVSSGRGFEIVEGSSAPSPRWALPVGSTAGGSESLSIFNPGRTSATVMVRLITSSGLSGPPELEAISIEPTRAVQIDLTPHLKSDVALALIEAVSGSIVVERRLVLGAPYADFIESSGFELS